MSTDDTIMAILTRAAASISRPRQPEPIPVIAIDHGDIVELRMGHLVTFMNPTDYRQMRDEQNGA